MSEQQPRVAVVTGGGSGIGSATCRQLAREGIGVAVTDLHAERAQQVAEGITAAGGRTVAFPLDVTDVAAIGKVFTQIRKQLGAIGILVNNAGIGDEFPAPQLKKFHGIYARRFRAWLQDREALELAPLVTGQRWARMLEVNLTSVFHCCQAVLPEMQQARWGRIVNVSSVAALAGSLGSPHYSAAKAGVLGLTRSLALEAAPAGITVNAVCPGLIETPMADLLPPEAAEWFLQKVPMHRRGTPEETAAAICFFASDAASYVTGQTLCVDGGAVM